MTHTVIRGGIHPYQFGLWREYWLTATSRAPYSPPLLTMSTTFRLTARRIPS